MAAQGVPENVAPPEVMAELSALIAAPEQRLERFCSYMHTALAEKNIGKLCGVSTLLYESTLSLPFARQVYAELCLVVLRLPEPDFMNMAMTLLMIHASPSHTRAFAFEQALTDVRDRMSTELEAKGNFKQAAEVLTFLPFDSMTALPNNRLLRFYVRIARLFLEAGVQIEAEQYLNRASSHQLMAVCEDHDIRVLFRINQARILDLKRKFEDAAMKYHQLSQLPPRAQGAGGMSDGDTVRSLTHAITCAILAPAGPRRSRVLAILYNDERSRTLPLFDMLESIHMGRLLQGSQIEKFRPNLQPHQLSTHSDGDTVLDRAVVEHNLAAASKLYNNIRFEELGELLGVSADKAEATAARMIYEKRMTATIDQVENLLEFSPVVQAQEIEKWDTHIESLCGAVDSCVDCILAKHPQFA